MSYRKKSVFFRWLTMAVLVVNLIACLALINMIHQQNEIDKFGIGEHKMRSVVIFKKQIETIMNAL